MFKLITKELKNHAPFTMFGAVTGILIIVFFQKLPKDTSYHIFYILHPMHVVLSAMVTASIYELHECQCISGKCLTGKCNLWKLLLIGYLGSIGIATISDSVIPYLGEVILGMPNRGIHIGFIEKWWLVNPLAIAGVLFAYLKPTTKFPHAGHVLFSTWASLFHILMAMSAGLNWISYLVVFLFLFLAVWMPCCLSDIVFPLLFVKEKKEFIMETKIIQESVAKILNSIPSNVLLVAAAKTRTPEELKAAINAGIKIVGYNYIQEAEQMFPHVENSVQWHLIGHLQRNKTKRAVQLFDMIETIDSLRIAEFVNRHCADIGKTMPVLIEINSGRESNKTGVLPEDVDDLVREISVLSHLRIEGLMTMGPRFGNPEDARPYFKATKAAFDRLSKEKIKNVQMQYLSMGMSNSYQIAIEEGANIVRIGTKLFGGRCSL